MKEGIDMYDFLFNNGVGAIVEYRSFRFTMQDNETSTSLFSSLDEAKKHFEHIKRTENSDSDGNQFHDIITETEKEISFGDRKWVYKYNIITKEDYNEPTD